MGKHHFLTRWTWLAVAALALVPAVATLPDFMREASTVAPATERTFSQLSPAELQILNELGLSSGAYAVFVLAWTLTPLLVYILIASVIFQRSADDSTGYVMSLILLGVGAAMPFIGGLTEFRPPWQTIAHFVRAAGIWLLLVMFFCFPDRRFVPRWSVLIVGLWAAWMVLWLFVPEAPWGLLDATGAFTPIGLLAMLLGFGTAIGAQVYRYRHVSTPVQRQQGKVFAFGFGTTFSVYVVAVAPYFIFPGVREPGWPYLLYGLIYVPLLTRLAFIVIPVIIGFAIRRYRLWDIDLIIRRTLIYGVLSTTLAVIYAGTVITLQPLFGAVTGQQQSELSTVISTLAVAALFGPLRGWVQQLIDRRFYRQKYDAGQALAAFSSSLANEVDVQRLTERLEDVIGRTLQPAHVSLWVKASTEAEARGTGRG